MSKTNRERALDILVAHSRQADFIGNDQYATVNCIGIQREIRTALDKAERRGARKACPCCKPQFDAEKVKHLISVLMYQTAKQGEQKGKQGISAYVYDEKVNNARKNLFDELGIE